MKENMHQFKTGKDQLILPGNNDKGDFKLKSDACVSCCSITSNKRNCNIKSTSDPVIKEESLGDDLHSFKIGLFHIFVYL